MDLQIEFWFEELKKRSGHATYSFTTRAFNLLANIQQSKY